MAPSRATLTAIASTAVIIAILALPAVSQQARADTPLIDSATGIHLCAMGDRAVQVAPATWTIVPRPDFDTKTAPLSELECRHISLLTVRQYATQFLQPHDSLAAQAFLARYSGSLDEPLARIISLRYIFPVLQETHMYHKPPHIALGMAHYDTSPSNIWAGAAVEPIPNGGAKGQPMFYGVQGYWTIVPLHNHCYSQNTSLWYGMGGELTDGATSSTVAQQGTDTTLNTNCTPTYDAWYENYPQPAINYSNFPVSPGDTMASYQSYQPNIPGGGMAFGLEDVTRNTWTGVTVGLVGGHGDVRDSAEAILEYNANCPFEGQPNQIPCHYPGWQGPVQFSGVQVTDLKLNTQPMCYDQWTQDNLLDVYAHQQAAVTDIDCSNQPQIL